MENNFKDLMKRATRSIELMKKAVQCVELIESIPYTQRIKIKVNRCSI